MSDDEGRRVRTQPDDRVGNLLGPAHSSDRLLRGDLLPSFGSAVGEAVHHRGGDVSGGDGVDADVLRGVVERRRPGQPDYAVLRGGVRTSPLDAYDPGA